MTDESLRIEDVVQQLGERRSDALMTLDLIDGYRLQVEEQRNALENPQAVADYLGFFKGFVGRAAAECERIAGEAAVSITPAHIATLRQLAAESATEQRRCLVFRDKCINKPLPYERMRPLLNEISINTRDQLTAFRDLTRAADRLQQLIADQPPAPGPSREFDRRSLFTRLLNRDHDGK